VRASTKAIVAVFALGLAASVAAPAAVGQDKPSESGPLDPRLKPLVGTWEGRVELKMSREEQGRTLVIRERGGQLDARFGIPGKNLERVVLSTEVDGGRPKISFKNSSGNTYTLELVKEDWLKPAAPGAAVRPTGRSSWSGRSRRRRLLVAARAARRGEP
jgi:hypothetical protein